ncbi:MAG: hypothetical protein MH204_09105 [Fimbriimonadaceae bacterium]|nr:hypothetical protein [Fimbriimonadaceae bacterium]
MAGAWMRAAGSAALGCGFVAATGSAVAQVPDLLSSVDAGSRAIALGGSTTATDITPHAALLNPAGLGYISAPPATVAFTRREEWA